jgi:hypothetical protein
MSEATRYVAEAIERKVNSIVVNEIRFHARACFNRKRSEIEMLRAVAKNYGYSRQVLTLARDEWTQAL